MNNYEFARKIKTITPEKIRAFGVGSVQLNQQKVINDLGDANNRGLTFSGDDIAEVGRFSDWIESGQFRDSLRFADPDNIDLTSTGDGFDAIRSAYSESDYIAPTATVLSESTISAIKKDFINSINNEMK